MGKLTMSVSDVLNMPSMNEWGTAPVSEWIDMCASDILTDHCYADIVKDTRERGINRDPVHIGPAADVYADYCSFGEMPDLVRASDRMLGNGHHRVAILHLLGFDQVYYTSDYDESYEGERVL